jgi:hypothetical protein
MTVKEEVVSIAVGQAQMSVPTNAPGAYKLARTFLNNLLGVSDAEQVVDLNIGAVNIGEISAIRTIYPPAIGTHWPEQGGVYAGVMRGEKGKPDYHLIFCDDEFEHPGIQWGSRGISAEGADSEFDGQANTAALVKSGREYPAASYASSLVSNGFSDWSLPARRELSLGFANVPEIFAKAWYWSSTQYSAYRAWVQHFDVGSQLSRGDKDGECRARAVRRLLTH